MRYISIDIETTGLDPDTCQVIEFAAIYDNLLSKNIAESSFSCFIEHSLYRGESYALQLNQRCFKVLSGIEKTTTTPIYTPDQFVYEYKQWLISLGCNVGEKVIYAGKNVAAFDLPFLDKIEGFKSIKRHHRTLDPAMLYLKETDTVPPDLKTCLRRAGLEAEVSHEALDDAMQVVLLLRHYFENK